MVVATLLASSLWMPHLAKQTKAFDRHRTMTFTSTQQVWPGQTFMGLEVFTPIPPSTGTQEGQGYSIQIIPLSGEAIPKTSIEEFDHTFATSEGAQPGHFMQWKRHPGDPAFEGGFKVVVTQKADLYQYLGLPQNVPPTEKGSLKPNRFADFQSPNVMQWGNTISPLPADDPALGMAAGVMQAEHRAVQYTGETVRELTMEEESKQLRNHTRVVGEVGVKRASKMLAAGGGDCGSFTILFQAGMLGSGYSARSVVGWNLAGGAPARHARSEVAARGIWVPVDATFAHNVDPMTCIGNGQYVQSAKFFTNHLGVGVYGAFLDRDKVEHQFERPSLQVPYVKLYMSGMLDPTKLECPVPGEWIVTVK